MTTKNQVRIETKQKINGVNVNNREFYCDDTLDYSDGNNKNCHDSLDSKNLVK